MALPINLLQRADGLRKTFVPLGLDKGILDSPYLLISLINIKSKKVKSWTHPKSSFPWTKRQNIWSSFIYSFFRARPFVQKLGTSLIYFVYMCTTIQTKYMVLFHLFIYLFIYLFICLFLCATIRSKIRVPLIYIFYLRTAIRSKYTVLFHLFFLLCRTILPKIWVLSGLLSLFAPDHLIKIYGPFSFILSFVHDHSTKNLGPR